MYIVERTNHVNFTTEFFQRSEALVEIIIQPLLDKPYKVQGNSPFVSPSLTLFISRLLLVEYVTHPNLHQDPEYLLEVPVLIGIKYL